MTPAAHVSALPEPRVLAVPSHTDVQNRAGPTNLISRRVEACGGEAMTRVSKDVTWLGKEGKRPNPAPTMQDSCV